MNSENLPHIIHFRLTVLILNVSLALAWVCFFDYNMFYFVVMPKYSYNVWISSRQVELFDSVTENIEAKFFNVIVLIGIKGGLAIGDVKQSWR